VKLILLMGIPLALLSGDPLSEDTVYAVYETTEIDRFERTFGNE
jgi:hypothetical protein